ncbi:hypothetical protein [Paraburkholderia sediminicola]|uniref:hypothetical protein n=1 Tax=Paraburkholderia sediminicola TaxID=458836 RepID=UPI0038B6FCD0
MKSVNDSHASLDLGDRSDANAEKHPIQDSRKTPATTFDVRVSKEVAVISAPGVLSTVNWRSSWGDGVKRLSVQTKTRRHADVELEAHCVVLGADPDDRKGGELVAEVASKEEGMALISKIERGVRGCLNLEDGYIADSTEIAGGTFSGRRRGTGALRKTVQEAAKVLAFIVAVVATFSALAFVAPAAWKVGERVGYHMANKLTPAAVPDAIDGAQSIARQWPPTAGALPTIPTIPLEQWEARRAAAAKAASH